MGSDLHGNTQVLPLGRSFTLSEETLWVCCNIVDHAQPSGGRPQELVCGCFWHLWQAMTIMSCKIWQLPLMQCSWANYVPSERMNTFGPMMNATLTQYLLWWEGGLLQLSQLCKGGHWNDKKPARLSRVCLLLAFWLIRGQNPACSPWWWVLTPSAPKWFPCTLSAKSPLLLQMVNYLS